MSSLNKIFLALTFVLLAYDPAHAQATKQKSIAELKADLERVNEAIKTTQEKMKTLNDARFLPDLYFILAENHVSRSRYLYNIKILENRGTPIEEIDFTIEKKPKLEAIEVYQKILDKFPTLTERDKALFFMAHEYRELGQIDKMIETYQKLTKEYPNSFYWSESQLIVANFIFEQKKDVDFAIELYKQILVRSPDHFTPLARYKLGIAYINKMMWKESLTSFENILTMDSKLDLSKLPEIYKKTDVKRDALLQMVWPYSELTRKELEKLGPGKTEPLEYFKSLANNLASYQRVLQRLGRRLVLKKRFLDSTRVYFTLLQISSDLDTRIEAVESTYKSMKDSALAWPINGYVEEIAKTINAIRFSENIKTKDKAAHEKNFEIFARDAATRLQARSRTSKANSDYQIAILAYNEYLWAFPNSPYNSRIRLNLAETYFNSGDLVLAGKNYELVGVRANAKQRKSVLDSALQAYTTALKDSAKLSILELAEARNGLRSMGAIYARDYKNDKALPEVMFNVGRTYYDERSFDNAVKGFENYLAKYPTDKDAALAVDLILDSYNQREDFDGLVAASKRLLKNTRLSQQIRNNVQEISKQASFKKIQVQSGDASSSGYAKNLLKFAAKYKGSDLGEQALYEAFITMKAKKDPDAYEPGEALLLKHGNSKYAKDVVSQMGQMALMTADFRRASNYFEVYAQKYPNDAQSKDLLKNAAQMREFMGDYQEASKDYQQLGNTEAAARNLAIAAQWSQLTQVAARVGGVKGSYWQGLGFYRMKNPQAAKPFLQQAADGRGRGEEAAMSAHALYLLSLDILRSYEQVQITPGQENQAVQLKDRLLQQLTQQFNRVIGYGNGRWTIAALYGLGKANSEFAEFIRRSPQPPGLSGPTLQQYNQLIQQQVQKYETAANQFYKQCLQNAEKFEVFTKFALGCQSKGRQVVDEASDTLITTRASQVAPQQAATIRRKLYDNSRDPKLLTQLSQVYSQNRDFAMAVAILSRAHEISPQTSSVLGLMGSNYLFMNDLENAAIKFKKALELNGNDSSALWGLAGLYNNFGYKSKLQPVLAKARRSGVPQPPVHPFVSSVR